MIGLAHTIALSAAATGAVVFGLLGQREVAALLAVATLGAALLCRLDDGGLDG